MSDQTACHRRFASSSSTTSRWRAASCASCSRRTQDIEIVAECANGFEAVKAVADMKPDLLLLDIQMPKLDGFDVLELIGRDIPVVFVTAYDEYALQAFEVHAVDYLLKPFGAERLAEALTRARDAHRVARGAGRAAAAGGGPRRAVAAPAHPDPRPRRRPRHPGRQDRLPRVAGRLRGGQGRRPDVSEGTDAERARSAARRRRFVRIHRRYILNLSRLAKLELAVTDSRIAILTDGTQLPVSRSGYARLRELL